MCSIMKHANSNNIPYQHQHDMRSCETQIEFIGDIVNATQKGCQTVHELLQSIWQSQPQQICQKAALLRNSRKDQHVDKQMFLVDRKQTVLLEGQH